MSSDKSQVCSREPVIKAYWQSCHSRRSMQWLMPPSVPCRELLKISQIFPSCLLESHTYYVIAISIVCLQAELRLTCGRHPSSALAGHKSMQITSNLQDNIWGNNCQETIIQSRVWTYPKYGQAIFRAKLYVQIPEGSLLDASRFLPFCETMALSSDSRLSLRLEIHAYKNHAVHDNFIKPWAKSCQWLKDGRGFYFK